MGNAFMTIDEVSPSFCALLCIFCADSLCEQYPWHQKNGNYGTLQSQWLLFFPYCFGHFLAMRFELIVTAILPLTNS